MPETNTPPPAPQAPHLPPIDPKALIDTAIAVLRNPTEFYKGIKGETGFQKCLVFAIAAGLVFGVLSGVGTFLWNVLDGHFVGGIVGLITMIIVGGVMGILGAFVGGFIVWGLSLAFGSKASWEPSIPIAAYAMAVAPAFSLQYLLPGLLGKFLGGLIALAAMVYEVYICVMGAKVINFEAPPATDAPPPPA